MVKTWNTSSLTLGKLDFLWWEISPEVMETIWYTRVIVSWIHNNYTDILRMDTHSVGNMLNGLYWYIQLLDIHLGGNKFSNSIDIIKYFLDILIWSSDIKWIDEVKCVLNLPKTFNDEFKKIGTISDDKKDKVVESLEIINNIMPMMEVCMQKVLSWENNEFHSMDINTWRNELIELYTLVGNSSRWKYWIVFNKDEKKENDYYIELDIQSVLWEVLYLSETLKAVIRDFIFNSIKYSHPWTNIWVDIQQWEENMIISITDEWMWISANELTDVFKMSYRSKKAQHRSWSGIWLAKAYHMIKEVLWGEIYIDSTLGIWTNVVCVIPMKNILKK